RPNRVDIKSTCKCEARTNAAAQIVNPNRRCTITPVGLRNGHLVPIGSNPHVTWNSSRFQRGEPLARTVRHDKFQVPGGVGADVDKLPSLRYRKAGAESARLHAGILHDRYRVPSQVQTSGIKPLSEESGPTRKYQVPWSNVVRLGKRIDDLLAGRGIERTYETSGRLCI